MEEEDAGKVRGHGRASSEKVKSGGRRPGEEIPASEQPREKIFKKHSSHESTPEERGSRGSGSSRSSSRSAEAGPSSKEGVPSGSGEPGPSRERERSTAETVTKREPAPSGSGDPRGGRQPRFRYEIVQTRPKAVESKRGKSGQPITLLANYFRLLTKPTWRIYQYHVDFLPEIELIRMKRGALGQHKSILGGYLFDGTKIFTTTKLREDKIELESKSPKTGELFKITIKLVGLITMSEWQSLQVLNLILHRAMEGLKLQLVGRNFFDPKAKIDIREFRLQLWPGYTTSIRQHEQDILLCAEIAHKVMRTETLLDILNRCIHENRHDYQDQFRKMVLGTTVLTDYNNKTYRIDDVDFNTDCRKTFKYKGDNISFLDYYKQKYDIRIRDPSQPLLVSVAKERQVRAGQNELCVLIPELCRATGLNETMRNNFQLMKAMSEYTRMNPPKRIERLRTFNRRLATSEKSTEVLNEWNMSLDPNLVQLQGRVLKPENIVFARGKKVASGDNADWQRHFRDSAMFTVAELKRWAVVLPNKNQREARDFIDCLMQAARGMNMIIRQPQLVPLFDDRNHSYIGGIDNSIKMDPQLIMCIVPNNNAERYGSIKKKTCVERAIATQVMLTKTIIPKRGGRGSLMSVATKVAIQMNCKLGSAAWMIELPLSGLMTIGYDICRSSKDKKKAFGALVATMDMKTSAKYFSTVAPCHASDQLSNEMSVSLTKALQEYRHEHGTLPNRILLYRDGVGDGQISQVVTHEVNTLVDRLKSIYKSAKIESGPRFAFVIVSKQINTRLFTDRGQNPNPGTVADDIITLPERYDFYLVSQSVRQGTVSPTSYNVVYDNMGLDPDRMQLLTYKMTHLYYNWSGTTRVPAVCQYAKKLATLVAQSIHQPPANALEKQLYFL